MALKNRCGLAITADPKFVSKIGYSYDAADDDDDDGDLVSSRLLELTSYEDSSMAYRGSEDDSDYREMVAAAAGPTDLMGKQMRNKKMSFDDLGKVYTNISRKRILSKVRAAVAVRVASSLAAAAADGPQFDLKHLMGARSATRA